MKYRVAKESERSGKWPKIFPPLSAEQTRISDDFIKHWLEVLPQRYSVVDDFNHRYVVECAPKTFVKTLEVGAGIGEHLKYEILTAEQERNYYAVDIRQNIVDALTKSSPQINAMVGDCQERMDFPDEHFDRILAIHVLEHLPNLPSAVKELHRLCCKANGVFSIVIPCEGSLAYSLARKISAQKIFEKRYKQSYKWYIEREHINLPHEIFEEIYPYFAIESSRYFPIPLKVKTFNLCIGATFRPRS